MGCISSSEGFSKKKKTLSIILLGIGGSGKSTFSKQMQFIHNDPKLKERAASFRNILLANVITALKDIGSKSKDLEDTQNYKKSRWIQTLDESQVEWDDELLSKVKELWKDEGIQQTWKEIKDNIIIQMEYLMENLDRFVQPDYVPDINDILRARQRTTGEHIYTFEDNENIWNLIDVGGQYSERDKWELYFSTHIPHAIIFFLALDEYNVPNIEISTKQYKTKFELAQSVFSDKICDKGPVRDYRLCRIVFLNKIDIFVEKIKDDHKWEEFKTIFKYTGERDPVACAKFIEGKLQDICNEKKDKKETVPDLKVHVTNALDTEMMKKISSDIKTSIVTITMKSIGML